MGSQSYDPISVERKREDELASYFESSAATVRQYADRFENDARPMVAHFVKMFETSPIMVTTLIVFSFLSFMPILAFVCACIFIVTSFMLIAGSFTAIAVITVVLFLGTILLSALTGALFLAVSLSTSLALTTLAVRFLFLIYQEGYAGAWTWASEVKQRFLGQRSLSNEESRHKHHFDREPPESAVLVSSDPPEIHTGDQYVNAEKQ